MRHLALVALLVGCGSPQAEPERPHVHRHAHAGHDFRDAEQWAETFDDPSRDEWQRPEEVIRLLGVEPGDTVADIGAGTGYFLPYLSRAVGERGHVLALDVEEAMVEHMRRRAEEEGLANVEPRLVAPDDPGLGDSTVNKILIVNTWHHIGDREAYAARLYRGLIADGCATSAAVVLVVDFTRDAPEGPPPEMRLEPSVVEAELHAGGLATRIVDEELPRQYAVRAERSMPASCTGAE